MQLAANFGQEVRSGLVRLGDQLRNDILMGNRAFLFEEVGDASLELNLILSNVTLVEFFFMDFFLPMNQFAKEPPRREVVLRPS